MNAPYFVSDLAKKLKNPDISEDERKKIRAQIALNIGDQSALRTLLKLDPEEFNSFYADLQPLQLDTDSTIDTFLEHYSRQPQPDSLQYAPAIDYAAMMENGMSDTMSATVDDTIPDQTANQTADSYDIEEDSEAEVPSNDYESPVNVDSTPSQSLSESLAKVMIKNHNYKKALEIIMELSLKNPEKSVYFADQIRFLRKLIYAQSRKNKRN